MPKWRLSPSARPVGNYCSEFFSSDVGLRQGENLSPAMFALFLNDLKPFLMQHVDGLSSLSAQAAECGMDQHDIDVLFQMFVLLYADDTVICAESADDLQASLDKLCDYCSTWSLTVNTMKTKIIVFSRGKIRRIPKFYYNGKEIEVVFDFKYLGLLFNYNNRFSVAQKDLYDRASRAMFSLLRRCRKSCLPLDLQFDLFDKVVLPILSYGCEVWCSGNCDLALKLQLRFYKIVLRLNKSTPSCMLFGELGRFPVDVHLKTRMLCYWYKLVKQANSSKYTSVMYRFCLKMYEKCNYQFSYIEFIKTLLGELGLHGVWLHQANLTFSLDWFKEKVKRCLMDQYIQKWLSEINNRDKHVYTNYRMCKDSFACERYFTLLSTSHAITLVRFRALNNKLPVQTERFNDTPRCERVCTKCNLNDIGDEYHMLLVCPYFKQQRSSYLPGFYWNRPSCLKFSALFNTSTKKTLNNLVTLIGIINAEFK